MTAQDAPVTADIAKGHGLSADEFKLAQNILAAFPT